MSYQKGQKVVLNVNELEEWYWGSGAELFIRQPEKIQKENGGFLTVDSEEVNGTFFIKELRQWLREEFLLPFEEEFPGAPTMSEIFTW
jgi:hypothetical protein